MSRISAKYTEDAIQAIKESIAAQLPSSAKVSEADIEDLLDLAIGDPKGLKRVLTDYKLAGKFNKTQAQSFINILGSLTPLVDFGKTLADIFDDVIN